MARQQHWHGACGAPRWSLRWTLLAVAIGMVFVTALLVQGLVRAIRAPRSEGVAAREIVFAAALVLGLPLLVGFGWTEMWHQTPDMVVWVAVAAMLGVATGLLRLRQTVGAGSA